MGMEGVEVPGFKEFYEKLPLQRGRVGGEQEVVEKGKGAVKGKKK